MAVFCTRCGAQNEDYSQNCVHCQAALPAIGGYEPIQPPIANYGQQSLQDWQAAGADKKIIGGIIAIVLGGLGIHKFMLGYQKEGVIMLCLSVLTCGALYPIMHVVGIVEGILYLTKSDEDFVRTYITARKGWF